MELEKASKAVTAAAPSHNPPLLHVRLQPIRVTYHHVEIYSKMYSVAFPDLNTLAPEVLMSAQLPLPMYPKRVTTLPP